MDDFFDVLIRLVGVIGRTLLFIAEFTSNILFEYVFWWLGWFLCRLYTLGRYPAEGLMQYERATTMTAFTVIVVGVSHVVMLLFLYFCSCV